MNQIPASLDIQQMLADLHANGWKDYKIEMACGFSVGYDAQLRCGNIQQITYQRGARLYNFWLDYGRLST